jgi:hypothetical protein
LGAGTPNQKLTIINNSSSINNLVINAYPGVYFIDTSVNPPTINITQITMLFNYNTIQLIYYNPLNSRLVMYRGGGVSFS